MNISFETVLFSLFDAIRVDELSSAQIDQKTIKPENILCLSAKTAEQMSIRYSRDQCRFHMKPTPAITAYIKDRQNSEFQNSTYGTKQVIVAACIHTEDQILFLKLNDEVNGVDGYHAGTLTYPQGHCNVSEADISRAFPIQWKDGLELDHLPFSDFIQILMNNMYRELWEELQFDDRSIMTPLLEMIKDAPIHPIYINKAGSTRGHICMLFDLEVSKDTPLYQYFVEGKIKSGEPRKHEVHIMKYEDLIPLGSLDYICTWVASSFELLPFMGTTFIQEYQNIAKKESAPNE